MGMTIDKAIEHGKEQLEIFGGEHKEFIVCALDTMQKYQKIEETINKWCADKTWEFDTSYLYEIMEVLEDGNDD